MNFTQTSKFNIGDKVYLKSAIDSLVIVTPASMQAFVSFDINKLLYKVDIIDVKATSTGTVLYYTISLVTAPTQDPAVTGVALQTSMANITESNLYSLAEGKPIIEAKVLNFNVYQKALT